MGNNQGAEPPYRKHARADLGLDQVLKVPNLAASTDFDLERVAEKVTPDEAQENSRVSVHGCWSNGCRGGDVIGDFLRLFRRNEKEITCTH